MKLVNIVDRNASKRNVVKTLHTVVPAAQVEEPLQLDALCCCMHLKLLLYPILVSLVRYIAVPFLLDVFLNFLRAYLSHSI